MRAVLVGLPGAGKTTVGALLAKRLGVRFADSDELVVTVAGKPVTRIFAEDGEAAFRGLEAMAIKEALAAFDGVLSLGGGAVLRADTRAALRESPAPVVHLDVPIAVLRRRVGDGATRPLLAGDVSARLQALADERAPLYAEVADLTLTGDADPADIAETIATLLETR